MIRETVAGYFSLLIFHFPFGRRVCLVPIRCPRCAIPPASPLLGFPRKKKRNYYRHTNNNAMETNKRRSRRTYTFRSLNASKKKEKSLRTALFWIKSNAPQYKFKSDWNLFVPTSNKLDPAALPVYRLYSTGSWSHRTLCVTTTERKVSGKKEKELNPWNEKQSNNFCPLTWNWWRRTKGHVPLSRRAYRLERKRFATEFFFFLCSERASYHKRLLWQRWRSRNGAQHRGNKRVNIPVVVASIVVARRNQLYSASETRLLRDCLSTLLSLIYLQERQSYERLWNSGSTLPTPPSRWLTNAAKQSLALERGKERNRKREKCVCCARNSSIHCSTLSTLQLMNM